MIQLSLPMRVTALSCTVPTCSVQNSRMVLRSPITSRVGSPPYFLSWLAAPMELNWKMRLSRPMVVWPSSTTCAATVVPAPIFTFGPITEYGPTLTPASSSALGSTSAVGWTLAMPRCASGDAAHRAHQVGLAGDLVADAGPGGELVDAGAGAVEGDLQRQLVARFHRPLEARVVDADEIDDRVLVEAGADRRKRQQRGRLRQRLEHQHARHHRAVREVADEVRLVDGDVLQRLDGLGVHRQHPVDQQDRVAVRQLLQDLMDVHHIV